MKTEFFDIIDTNLASFAKELDNRLLDGWAISKTNPGEVVGVYGGTFTISLFRNETTLERLRNKVGSMEEKPKLSRGEILAKAREAKANKGKIDISTIKQ